MKTFQKLSQPEKYKNFIKLNHNSFYSLIEPHGFYFRLNDVNSLDLYDKIGLNLNSVLIFLRELTKQEINVLSLIENRWALFLFNGQNIICDKRNIKEWDCQKNG